MMSLKLRGKMGNRKHLWVMENKCCNVYVRIKGSDGNGELVNHDVVATNELSHSCLIGF
jgi:hypothetical protein